MIALRTISTPKRWSSLSALSFARTREAPSAGKRFTVLQVPVRFLSVDEDVNPRHLQRSRLEKMVEAFRSGQTRFQVTQCRLLTRDENRDELAAFDGSHGTAAEILAGAQQITCKVIYQISLLRRKPSNGTLMHIALSVSKSSVLES
jgi:hypothetical protein